MAIVRLEGLGQLQNSMTSTEFEPATFPFVSILPQPTTLPRAPIEQGAFTNCIHHQISI
jgi:hypothetical protein